MFSPQSSLSPWLIRPCARPAARIRLLCFPRAGGGAAAFRGWAEDCDPEIEVVLVQPPGRENRLREEPVTSMQTMAAAIADALAELPERPCAFFGHSLGAKVAFETARELRRRGQPEPLHLFAAASAGPGVTWNHPLLHLLGDAELLAEVQRRYGGVPQEVLADAELCALLTPVLRADLTVVETYRCADELPLTTPITCFCGADDGMTPIAEASEWRRHTASEFQLHRLPGDHFFPVQARARIPDRIAAALQCGQLWAATESV